MSKRRQTEARQWLIEFLSQYRQREQLIDLSQLNDTEVTIGLMGGEKIKRIKKDNENGE